jgi:hypothetical protein
LSPTLAINKGHARDLRQKYSTRTFKLAAKGKSWAWENPTPMRTEQKSAILYLDQLNQVEASDIPSNLTRKLARNFRPHILTLRVGI